MFNPKRLSLARKRRRLTAKALAESAAVSADTITRLEKGLNKPDDFTVSKIARALSYPESFFSGDDIEEIQTSAVSFRSFSKMSAGEREAALAAGSLGLQLCKWATAHFSLPTPNMIDLGYEADPEMAAYALRQYWGIGERPIGDMIGLLETNGVRVLSLSENTASVNAFSFWQDDIPYVFLNNFKTAESSIFDSAHELGHLVMHKHGHFEDSRAIEKEANAFASAFLMPKNDVISRVRHNPSVNLILQAKIRWRVSAMAMAYRLNSLELLSEWGYKSACIELTRRGYRISEPTGVEREKSIVWRKILTQLWREKITKNEIANNLGIPIDELEGLIWNLTGDANPAARDKPFSLQAVGN
jgi:Zn-dependent peptidase ImmA (M78 family)/transcriptional regulator with XRE-family HTH domain